MGVSRTGITALATVLLMAVPASAEEVKTQAVITAVDGARIEARSVEGPVNVVVGSDTSIEETSGLLRRKTRTAESLIPGLILTVEGDRQGDTITAESVRFKESDWRAAIAAKAGTTAQFSELRQAIIDGQEYVVRDEATVYFASGSTTIADEYKQELAELARHASSYGNYRVSVLGFADPHGDTEANERLSGRRALAVSNYMRQSGSIEPGRVLAPSPMGEGATAPGEAPPANDAEARRVLVRIVTPKGQLQ